MQRPRNIAGPEIRRLRVQRGLTQQMLVAKCNLLGWNISRETLAKIECQVRWLSDLELLFAAKALAVPVEQLLPGKAEQSKAMRQFVQLLD
jgi:transcriptional regulator with XRE-family HTH domain